VAIALLSGVVLKAEEDGRSLNAFYCRKSRKVDGMQRNIEGALTDEPVVLIDDALNSGKSIIRQIKALEAEGKRVEEVCVIVAFREPSYYEYLNERGIRIWSIFTLEDFPETGGLLKQEAQELPSSRMPYTVHWKFQSENPNYNLVVPKSAPVCDDERVYFGADNGTMWALRQSDGSVVWSFQTFRGAGKKRIFSSPALYDGTIYFGAYDGNFYALDSKTGKKRWINFDADWIGSSPCIAEDLGFIYVGLEFGLWRKHGGIACFDAQSGQRVWWQQLDTHVHSSPAYSSRLGIVAVGSMNGDVCAFDAKTGNVLWRFSEAGDVKGGLAFDDERELVVFGSWDKSIYAVDARTGKKEHVFETYRPIYSNPVVRDRRLYMGLIDKRIVCIDLETWDLVWQFQAQTRVFATPEFIDNSLYCGGNDGRLYEIDPETGAERSFFQTTERVVNKVTHNPRTGRIFLPTYANEIYCIERQPDAA
jgi:outer membrane protein assembly factor BamB